MPARPAAILNSKKGPASPLFWLCLLVIPLVLSANTSAQSVPHSPGWVVLPVDEYRTLHARAYPTEHDPEPPPVEATLTRVDYDLHINSDLASGRATLTVDVLKDGWVDRKSVV